MHATVCLMRLELPMVNRPLVINRLLKSAVGKPFGSVYAVYTSVISEKFPVKMASVHLGVGYSDYMWINFIQLAMLLIIDLFVFFFIQKIFFKLNKK